MKKNNKKYHLITLGCLMNISDSERIARILEKQGFKWADKREAADLVIVTTCGVRQKAEDRIYGLIPRIKKENPKAKIILTGCLVNRPDVRRRLEKYVDLWIPVNEILNFKLQILNKIQNSKFKIQNCSYLSIKPKYSSKFSALVPIGNGCNNFCTYCVVPYARGREVYRPAEEIIKEVKELVKKGYKEIVLIAQNVNSYRSKFQETRNKKQNKEINFAKLLKMVNEIPGDFWIRFLTSHPKDMSEELIKTIADCEKICEHIHLPAQSGDDKILEKTNRKYTREHYLKLIKMIKKNFNFKKQETRNKKQNKNKELWKPPVAITTDIIVGFPGETKKQFINTLKLFKEVKFDMAYISQYSPRFGTAAFKMDDNVRALEKQKREKELDKVLRQTALKNNKKYLSKKVEILLAAKKGDRYFGRTRTGKYIEVVNKNKKLKVGEFIKVKILAVKEFGMKGEIVIK